MQIKLYVRDLLQLVLNSGLKAVIETQTNCLQWLATLLAFSKDLICELEEASLINNPNVDEEHMTVSNET